MLVVALESNQHHEIPYFVRSGQTEWYFANLNRSSHGRTRNYNVLQVSCIINQKEVVTFAPHVDSDVSKYRILANYKQTVQTYLLNRN
jgi:chitinase